MQFVFTSATTERTSRCNFQERRRSHIQQIGDAKLGLAQYRNALSRLGAARMAGSLWSASSLRLQPMRPWPPPVCRRGACFPLSACVCTSRVILVWRVCGSPLYARLALAVRYSLTLWFGISRRGEETPTKMRRNMWVGLCECSV